MPQSEKSCDIERKSEQRKDSKNVSGSRQVYPMHVSDIFDS